MTNPPVFLSVVLSTYNEEKYIAKSIQSILDQTYPYFEFIIVNDGSTDNTLQIIESFEDPRIIIINKANSGLPDSLNRGIEIARYDWIARMDGDDIAEPDRFETQVKYINDRVGIIGGQFVSIDEEGNEISGVLTAKPLKDSTCRKNLLLGMSPLAHPTVLIRKSCLYKFGKYDINFKAAQDIELWSRLVPDIEIINVPNRVLLYRKHASNISNKHTELQRKLSFLGFLKYALKIRRPITCDEYEKFEGFFSLNGLIGKNDRLFKWSHCGCGTVRKVKLIMYYMWRYILLIKLRFCRNFINKKFLYE